MLALINYRLRVTLNDSRTLTGQMLAFDRHLNLVLADCEEFRFIKQKKRKGLTGATTTDDGEELEMKRALGLVILRGETIVSLSVEGPPPVVADDKGPVVRHLSMYPAHIFLCLTSGRFGVVACSRPRHRCSCWPGCWFGSST